MLAGLLGAVGCSDPPTAAAESSTSASSDSDPPGTSDPGTATTTAESSTTRTTTGSRTSASTGVTSSTAATTPGTDSGGDTSTGDPPKPPTLPLCGTTPPPGATLAPELPSFGGGGMCPVIETDGSLNCSHATPPFEPGELGVPTFAPAWEFFLDHPYWLEDGESPYQSLSGGLPDSWPQWCSIGAGNADIRVGECGGSECE